MLSVLIGLLIALLEHTSKMYWISVQRISVSRLLHDSLSSAVLAAMIVATTICAVIILAFNRPFMTVDIDIALALAFPAQAFLLSLTGLSATRGLLARSTGRTLRQQQVRPVQ